MPIKFKTKSKRATTVAKLQAIGPMFPSVKTGASKKDPYAKMKQARTFKVKPPRKFGQIASA